VNALDVGMVSTELTELHYGGEAGAKAISKTVPLGRLATPDDIGPSAVFLASPLAGYISGARLVIHGGGEAPAFLSALE
jgi:NAD(P)-dependent dehydrogenase (short-subunit alcohol dehydrogenase family)